MAALKKVIHADIEKYDADGATLGFEKQSRSHQKAMREAELEAFAANPLVSTGVQDSSLS